VVVTQKMQTNEFAFSQTISELDELHEIVKGSDLMHTQFTPGSFHAKTTRINLDASFLDIGEYNQGIRAQGGIDSEGKTFFFSLHQEANANVFYTNQDQFVAFGSGATVDAYGDINVKWVTLTIKNDEWLKLCQDLDHWTRLLDQPRAISVHPSPPPVTQLLQSLQSVAEMAVTSSDLFKQADVRESVHHELMSLIKECLSTSDRTPKKHLNVSFQRRYQIVKQAEAFITAHLDRKIYIADICENARVSERNLQYAFRDVLDLSPYEFITLQRLNKARRALSLATSDQITVNELAIKCGFWHMGRFSRAYKALFGELPSKTIRRRGSSQ